MLYRCPVCDSKMVSLPVLKRVAGTQNINKIWDSAIVSKNTYGKKCPLCDKNMTLVCRQIDGVMVNLDVCRHCFFIWFDPQEYEQFPRNGSDLLQKEFCLEYMNSPVKEISRINHKDSKETDSQKKDPFAFLFSDSASTEDMWQSERALVPYGSYILAALMIFVFIISFTDVNTVIGIFAFNAGRNGFSQSLTLLLSLLIHKDIIHLSSNLFFLLLFGRYAEEQLGLHVYLAMIALAHVTGIIFETLIAGRSGFPLYGGGAAISAVISCYAFMYPAARISLLARSNLLRIYPLVAMALWFVFQWIQLYAKINLDDGFSLYGYCGGILIGLLFWIVNMLRIRRFQNSPARWR